MHCSVYDNKLNERRLLRAVGSHKTALCIQMINGYKICILSNKIQPQNTKIYGFYVETNY